MSDLTKQINQLAKKAKEEGLSDEEKLLQQELRKKFIEGFRKNLENQLKCIQVDGNESNNQ